MSIRDLLAVLIVVGCFVLIGLGIKPDVFTGVLMSMMGYMFGAHTNKSKRTT